MPEENWDDYRFVLALHRHGSVAAAARALGVDETTVVRRLSQVERALGARLFERERGRVTPTAAARGAMDRLEGIDDGFRALRDGVSGTDRQIAGTVAVTAVPMITNRVLVPRLPELLERHPRLEIELVVDSALLGITRRREADIAIRGARPTAEPDAVTRKLGDMSYGVYCRRDLVEVDEEPDPRAPDRPAPGWIAYLPNKTNISRPQARWIDARVAEDGGAARARVNDGETLLECALAGLGKTLLADALARRHPALVRLDDAVPTPSRELWMLVHPSYREVRRVDVVASWLVEVMREFLSP